MIDERKPCEATSMKCVAFAEPGRLLCLIHQSKPALVPQEITQTDEYLEGFYDGKQAAADEAAEQTAQA